MVSANDGIVHAPPSSVTLMLVQVPEGMRGASGGGLITSPRRLTSVDSEPDSPNALVVDPLPIRSPIHLLARETHLLPISGENYHRSSYHYARRCALLRGEGASTVIYVQVIVLQDECE